MKKSALAVCSAKASCSRINAASRCVFPDRGALELSFFNIRIPFPRMFFPCFISPIAQPGGGNPTEPATQAARSIDQFDLGLGETQGQKVFALRERLECI